jgi:hypothetical protein
MKKVFYTIIIASLALIFPSCKKASSTPYVRTGGWWVYKGDTTYVTSSNLTNGYQGIGQNLTATDSPGHKTMFFEFRDDVPATGVCPINYDYQGREVEITLSIDTVTYKAQSRYAQQAYVTWSHTAYLFGIQGWGINFENVHNPADSAHVDFIVDMLH